MTEQKKSDLIEKMTVNLTMLRTKLGLTQSELADIIGLSRFTLSAIENRQRKMTWNTFLPHLLVFKNNDEVSKILEVVGIYDDELNDFLNPAEARN